MGQDTISVADSRMNDTIRLQEVTIEHGQQTAITGALSGKLNLHVEGVKKLPSIMGNTNLIKLLELTPGVQASGDGNSNLYVRGGEPAQNLLLYNENTIYSAGHLLSFFPLFNADHLSSIEFSKSGVNPFYGGYLSSVINIKAKDNIPQKSTLQGSVGLLSSQATGEIVINNKWGAYVSGRVSYLELLLKPLLKATINEKKGGGMDDLRYDFYDGNVTLVGKLSEKNKLLVNFFHSSDDLNVKDDDIILNGYLKWKNIAGSVKLETQWNDKTLEQYILYNSFKNRLQTSQGDIYIRLLSKVEDIGYKNRLNYSIADIPFSSGIQYTYHNILPQETAISNIGTNSLIENMGYTNAHDIALYTSAILRFSPRFFIEPGLRYNIYDAKIVKFGKKKTFTSLDLRLSGRYKLSDATYLRGAYSHNTQYLNKLTPSSLGLPTDFWITASADVLPQRGDEYSAGYYRIFNDGLFELSSDVYYREMNNVTEYDQNFIKNDRSVFTDNISYGKGRAYGLELMLKKNTGKVTGWISYGLGKSDRRFAEIDNGKSFPAKFDRRHDLSLAATYTINTRWDASMVYVYATGNAYTLPSSWYFMNGMPVKEYGKYNSARMPDYNRMDLSVNYWFKKDNGLNFSIYNAFSVSNPVYVFLLVNYQTDKKTGENKIGLDIKHKMLFKLVPSVSWKYKF